RFNDYFSQIAADPVMGRATPDFHPGRTNRGEALGIVWRGRDRFGEIASDLSLGDIEGGDELDMPDMVAAEVEVQNPGNRKAAGRVAIKFDALHQRRRAVPDPDQRDPDFCQYSLPDR